MSPDQATAETLEALGDAARRFRVISQPNPYACAPLRELPGIVQLSADSRSVIIFRAGAE